MQTASHTLPTPTHPSSHAGEPLFPGRGELDQIKRVFALLGTPRQEEWPGWDSLPYTKALTWKDQEPCLRSRFPALMFGSSQPTLSEAGLDLLTRMLALNPAARISAADALRHPWFTEAPRPVSPALMPTFAPRHASAGGEGFRDKLGRPSPGAVAAVGFGK